MPVKKNPWRSFATKSGGSVHRQDSRYKTGNTRTAAQKRASAKRKKR